MSIYPTVNLADTFSIEDSLYPSRVYRVGDCNEYWLVVIFALESHGWSIHLRHSIIAHGEGAEIERVDRQHMQYPGLLWGHGGGVHGQNLVGMILIHRAQLPHDQFMIPSMANLP